MGDNNKIDPKTIYYNLKLKIDEQDELLRQYSYLNIQEFHLLLVDQFPHMPFLPAKSILKLNNEGLEKRRKELEEYFNILCKRVDIKNSLIFQQFFQISTFIPNLSQQMNLNLLNQISDFPYPIIDFFYYQQNQLLIAILADIFNTIYNLETKIDNFFKQMFLPTSAISNSNNNFTGKFHGQVICFQLKGAIFQPELLWEYNLDSVPSCFVFEKELALICIGFCNGAILCLSVQLDQVIKVPVTFATIKRHYSKVMGLVLCNKTATLYSISSDKSLLVSNIKNPDNIVVLQEINFVYELVKLTIDKPNDRLFISDKNFQIFILRMKQPIQILRTLQIQSKINNDYFNCLQFDLNNEFLIAGTKNGKIFILQLYALGKEEMISIISQLEGCQGQCCLQFDKSKKLLYYDYNNNVQISCTLTKQEKASFKVHNKRIIQMLLIENAKILITTSLDKQLKIWCIDEEYWQYAQMEQSIYKNNNQNSQKSNELNQNKYKIIEINEGKDLNISEENKSEELNDLQGWNQ